MNIQHEISFDATAHIINVKLSIDGAKPKQKVSMATWVPGSYLIRDFAKHIVRLKAFENGQEIEISALDKSSWCCHNQGRQCEIHYEVFAFDNTPRGAYLDNEYAFFDGARVFMQVEGGEAQSQTVKVKLSEQGPQKQWHFSTSMPKAKQSGSENIFSLIAKDYFDLIDHPFVAGNYEYHRFDVNGLRHAFVIIGQHYGDIDTLIKATRAICKEQMDFFADVPEIAEYLFILRVNDIGYGGIEHRHACSLLAGRESLPDGPDCQSDAYFGLLGLISHEYFHLWNVKRLRPKVFVQPDLSTIQYTEQLWIFEGITSYYDDLMLVRSGQISPDAYFKILAKNFTRYFQNIGANHQTLAESSFTAWTKFYQPDSNSNNANVSYYLKGALVALALDLYILEHTQGQYSLQSIMQAIWQDIGKPEKGLDEGEFEAYAQSVTGLDLSAFFGQNIRQTTALNWDAILAKVGLQCVADQQNRLLSFGLQFQESSMIIGSVRKNSIAENAGLCPGDQLVAIDQLKATLALCEQRLKSFDKSLTLHVLREDKFLSLEAANASLPWIGTYAICPLDKPTDSQQALQEHWLGS